MAGTVLAFMLITPKTFEVQEYPLPVIHPDAGLLRAKAWDALDVEHLAEEIEALRKSERNAVRSHLRILLLHLLQWAYQLDKRGESWRSSVGNARVLIEGFLEDSPSLQPELPGLATSAYPWARQRAAKETRLPLATFPEACPWRLEQILDDDFWPEE